MKYFIDNKIGEPGGFGDVYDCHSELGDRYAIKMLKTDDENAVLRFQKEVRLTSRLNHPNVIRIIACDTEGENKYYIMPKYLNVVSYKLFLCCIIILIDNIMS